MQSLLTDGKYSAIPGFTIEALGVQIPEDKLITREMMRHLLSIDEVSRGKYAKDASWRLYSGKELNKLMFYFAS